ncbi:MAG: M28 family peptidase [Balneolales bacterium]
MRIILLLNLLVFCSLNSCTAQTPANTQTPSDPYSYQENITADYLRNHLEHIAHDSLMGRQTGTEGLKKAAAYLADYHGELGMDPIGDDESYYQYFNLHSYTLENVTFKTSTVNNGDTSVIDESLYQFGQPAPFTYMVGTDDPQQGDIVFAGFGALDEERNVDNFGQEELDGNWVMVFEQIPFTVNGDTLVNPKYTNQDRIYEVITERNAAGLIVISDFNEDEYREKSTAASMELGSPMSLSLDSLRGRQPFSGAYLTVSPEFAAEILGLEGGAMELANTRETMVADIAYFQAYKTGVHLEVFPEVDDGPIRTQNVVSYFEGSDPELKDEVVVLMAHYDHVGVGPPDENSDYIFNGADDNGSGTATMLSIARSFKEAADAGVRPRRSIVFLHVAAEEWGLYGSRYYSDNPIIPIQQTVANINMDMIGRRDQEHINRNEEDFIYIIGAEIISSDLDSLLQEGNRKSSNITLNMRYNDLNDPNQFYRRSDHWNFGRLEVPFIFFFSGVHEDYHGQGDSVDDILFDALEKRARLIYATTLEVANADNRPEVDSEEFIRRTRNNPR